MMEGIIVRGRAGEGAMATQHATDAAWASGRATVSAETARGLDAYWRCANYLSLGQIYLRANPLLRRPLELGDVKPRPVGHWGTIPGLNFLYAHLNRLAAAHAQRTLVVVGPGHGGNAVAVSSLVDGSYTERYPYVTDDEQGLATFMRDYAAPGGMPSNATPVLPGSIHTGGELGYTLSHAFGAAFDNPDQLIVPIVGDGESEEGAIASAWSMSRIMNPATDGIVLPILHLNGYKITMPSLIAAATPVEREMYFRGLGYDPVTFTVGFDDEDPISFHTRFAELLEDVYERICEIKAEAAAGADAIVCSAADVPVLLCFADCVPVIVVAQGGFAVAHSGWKGTFARIAGKTAAALMRATGAGPAAIHAYIGPHITGDEYEVSQDLLARFAAEFKVVTPNEGRLLDLSAAICEALEEVGVPSANICDPGLSTMKLNQRFFSYRKEEGRTGRHAAIAFMP